MLVAHNMAVYTIMKGEERYLEMEQWLTRRVDFCPIPNKELTGFIGIHAFLSESVEKEFRSLFDVLDFHDAKMEETR